MVKYFRTTGTAVRVLFSWIIYAASFLTPRDKNLWVFIGWLNGGEREIFAENPKYLFLYASNNRPDIKSVWLGQDKKICKILNEKGCECAIINSPRGIYYSLRAGYTFIGAFMALKNWRYSGGSRVVQLWHGKGPKKAGYESPYSLKKYNKLLHPNLFKNFYKFISASDYLAKFVISDFNAKRNDILLTGFPKYDVFFSKVKGSDIDRNKEMEQAIYEARSKNAKKLFLYAPTFRPSGSNILNKLNLDALNELFLEKKYYLVGTMHPKFASKNLLPKKNFTNIKFVKSGYDIYPLLPKFDELITDYSSLATDFIMLDKPIIFFAPDIEEYKKSMGLHEKLWNLLPGPRIYSFEGLKQALIDDIEEDEDIKEKRRAARDILFKYKDGNSSRRIAELLTN